MRDILFRGKRADSGEWVYGSLLIMNINGRTCSLIVGSGFSLVGNNAESNNRAPLVDPETVGQYTGLTDKNGKKIFEGDLVVATNRRRLSSKPYIVEFCQRSGYWMCASAREPLVIGNIHDNPELLGGADNGE